MTLEQSVAPAIHRMAAQHLESIRGTPMAPHADRARISGVQPIYRPDLEEVAYYEFTVDLGVRIQRLSTTLGVRGLAELETPTIRGKSAGSEAKAVRLGASRQDRLGFIVVSTGSHDFPIPHWSLDRTPPSLQLAAANGEGSIARLFKVDSLCYVAEAEDGALVSQIGQMPTLVSGLPHDLKRRRGSISTLSAEPGGKAGNEEKAEAVEHRVKIDGEDPPKLEPVEVDGWPAFKERYGDLFGPFLDDLRRQAAPTWELQKLIDEMGEGIRVGDSLRIALIQPEAAIDLAGEGAQLIRADIDESSGVPTLVLEVPRALEVSQEVDLEVHIRYPDGVDEQLRFFLVSDRTPSNRRVPLGEGGE